MISDLTKYVLHMADNALILGHRNSEWTGHGPILEQDIALSNIALDLIGQARYFYQYAAELAGEGATEDTLAYLRDPNEFLNCLLVEQENGDWGKTILRQFLFSAYAYALYKEIAGCSHQRLAEIAEKGLKEVRYHLRWSGEWVIRLGRGTPESGARMRRAMQQLWDYTGELFIATDYEKAMSSEGIMIDHVLLKSEWENITLPVLERAGLEIPTRTTIHIGGKEGKHSLLLQQLLEEMQYMQRTYPGAKW